VEIVTAYLEDTLDDDLRRRFERHLTSCDDCVAYIETMRRTVVITGATIESGPLPAGLRNALRHAFADRRRDQNEQ
jgi:anti-sigma factor RsiW